MCLQKWGQDTIIQEGFLTLWLYVIFLGLEPARAFKVSWLLKKKKNNKKNLPSLKKTQNRNNEETKTETTKKQGGS